ncbi:ATP-binding cassette domain-containing protein [Salinimicrobium sp. MT39]|uniref:ATP-binding cassette domain-containing protein n=1 Tax=Salinimicrobium profundisediminis TaxID=2994553 RepID=A0A9X3HZF4_9FLAO|nr:ATP-binding cassette domain-containing protein [Salinimicrobium profundisediminis]MCX2836870.1 ATP-binding cassette domain-containing protein [Salinimicrobium profundisediminis]
MRTLEVSKLSHSFGKNQLLCDVAFSCKTGEIIGLFGRNGSGKSTLLKAVMGIISVDAVSLTLDGVKVKTSEVIPKKMTGYLPQDSFLPKELKVRDVIPLIFPEGEAQDRIFYSPGVAAFENKKVGKLSAGQLKYLELLLLAHMPHPFLLLDEPFSMVEPQYIEKIKELLFSLKATKGIVVTDHYYRDVLEIAVDNFILKKGELHKVENEEDLATHEYLKVRNQ